jgi:hypothetical protein
LAVTHQLQSDLHSPGYTGLGILSLSASIPKRSRMPMPAPFQTHIPGKQQPVTFEVTGLKKEKKITTWFTERYRIDMMVSFKRCKPIL